MKTRTLILTFLFVLLLSGCGLPIGKDFSAGSSGGNAIKLDNSHNNVVIITDGQLDPEKLIDSAGNIVPNLPELNLPPTSQPAE